MDAGMVATLLGDDVEAGHDSTSIERTVLSPAMLLRLTGQWDMR
jgi:hypothetical protein